MFYFVRHGQTDWNVKRKIQGQTDIPLNETGRQQAIKLRTEIKDIHLDKIMTSDLTRARETADLIKGNRDIPIVSDVRLREVHFGDWEGQLIPHLTPEVWYGFQFKSQEYHSEPLSHAYQRICDVLSACSPAEDILFVTHGAILKLIAYYIGIGKAFDYTFFAPTYRDLWISNSTLGKWNPSDPEKGLIFGEK